MIVRDASVDAVEADALEALLPRLDEPVPRLGAVADDGEAPRRAPQQQHLPLGVGEFLRLVHDDVRERAGEHLGVAAGQPGRIGERVAQIVAAQHRHHQQLGVVARDQIVDDAGHLVLLGGKCHGVLSRAARGARVAEAQASGVEQREIGDRPGCCVGSLQRAHLVGTKPRRALAQVGGHRPEVTDEIGMRQQRPRAIERQPQFAVARQCAAQQVVGRLVLAVLVDEDREQLVPHDFASVVVRRAGWLRFECFGPVGGADLDFGIVDLHRRRRIRRLFVEAHRRLDRADQLGRGLEPSDGRVCLCACGRPLGDEVTQCAGLHALLAQAGQHVGDVGEVGLVRSDEQHAAAAMA